MPKETTIPELDEQHAGVVDASQWEYTKKPQVRVWHTGPTDNQARGLLATKLAEVAAEVQRVPKTGRNKAQGYDYATEADVADVVRGALSARRVALVPSFEVIDRDTGTTKSGSVMRYVTVRADYQIIDGDTGEVVHFTGVGEGQDTGDKAIYKAMTGATKYAMLKLFQISTGDDPEADERAAQAQAKQAAQVDNFKKLTTLILDRAKQDTDTAGFILLAATGFASMRDIKRHPELIDSALAKIGGWSDDELAAQVLDMKEAYNEQQTQGR